MKTPVPDAVQARAARIAGAAYLISMATAVFAQMYVKSMLVAPGNSAKTAQNIITHESLFRIGMVADIATSIGVAILIWALYVLLKPLNRNLALLAAMLRLLECAVGFIAILGSLAALRLLSGADYLKTIEADQLHALAQIAIGIQGSALTLSFILLGLGSTVFAGLLLKSRFVPRVLAAWGIFSSLLLSAGALSAIIIPAFAKDFQFLSMLPLGLYEVTLGFWLLLRGVKTPPSDA